MIPSIILTLNSSPGGGGSATLTITAFPTSALQGTGVLVSGTYTGPAPTGVTGVWNNGAGSKPVSNFSAVAGLWSATFTTPITTTEPILPISYILTVTGQGPNTGQDKTGTIVISPPAPTLTITSAPSSANTSSPVFMSGTYSTAAPTSVTGAWDNGGGAATLTQFSAANDTFSATFNTPSVAGTYHLTITGTGLNTASSTSGPIVVTVATSTITILSYPTSMDAQTIGAVTGNYTNATPAGMTGLWNPGAIDAQAIISVSNVTPTWTTQVTAPPAAGTYTLTLTSVGPNTGHATTGPVTIATGLVAPGNVVSLASPSQTPTSIILTWAAGSGGPATSWPVLERTPSGIGNYFPASGVSGATGATITGLTPGTTYDFDVIASNGAGSSPGTFLINVSTPAVATAPGAVANLASTGQTPTSVTLSWTAGTGGTATSWTVAQRTPSGSGSYVASTGTFGANGGTVTNLTSASSYDFQVVASNATGNSPASTLTNISTPATPVAPGPVANLAASAQTPTTITLVWGAGAGGTATSWTVVQRSPSGSGNYGASLGTFGATGGTVLNLTASTSYDFQVVASNAVGSSSPATLTNVSTAAALTPGAVTNLVSTSQTSSSVTLAWSAGSGGTATSWAVTKRTPSGSGSYVAAAGTFTASGGTVTGLTASSSYDFQVVASNTVGGGPAATLTNISTTASGPTAFTLAAYSNQAEQSGAIHVTLGWTGTTPTGDTLTWSGGGGSATITGFTVTGKVCTFFASTPAATGTYTLSGTGWATGPVTVSLADSTYSAGIHGPTTIQMGRSVQEGWAIGSFFGRGAAGPLTWTTGGTDGAKFNFATAQSGAPAVGAVGILVGNFGSFDNPATSFSITVTATDGVTTLGPLAVTINNEPAGPVITVNNNFASDAPLQPVNFWGTITACSTGFAGGASNCTMTDPSGLFVAMDGGQSITIAQANINPSTFGVHNITLTPNAGPPITVPIFLTHEGPPALQWAPAQDIYTSTPPTNGYGTNLIGILKGGADSGVYTYTYTSNPTGALNTYSFDVFYGRTGNTYLLSSVAAGTLAGTCQVESTNGVVNNMIFTLPVGSGTSLPASNMAGVPVTGLTNFLPTANILSPSGSPTVVLNMTASGFTPDWSKAQVNVINDNCQQTNGQVFPAATYVPRYAIQGSGATGTVTAWNLSAINETTPQVDQLVVTLTDGAGNYCVGTFGISTAWHVYSGGQITVGPGGTFADLVAFGTAVWAAPATYAGAKIRILRGCPIPAPFYGPTFTTHGWWPCPLIFTGDETTQASFTGAISGTTLTVTGASLVSFVAIGDSITAGFNNPPGDAPPNFAAAALTSAGDSVVLSNSAVSGSNSIWWQPAAPQGYFPTAIANGAALSPPANIATIMLGVNDAKTPNYMDSATHLANMTAIVNQLVTDGYTVILMDVMYINPTNTSLPWDSTAAALILQYNTAVAGLDNGTTIRYFPGLWQWAHDNQGTTYFQDGVHPTVAGAQAIGNIIAGYIEAVAPGGVIGAIHAGDWIATGNGVTPGTTIVSGSGSSWVVDTSQTVAATAMTTQMQQIVFDNPAGWSGDNQGKGGFHKAGGYDLILRRIALGHVTNGSNAGAFYVENEQPGNFTLEFCYAYHNDMGYMNGDQSNRIWLTDCLFVANGNGAGSSHNIYCDGAAALTITRCYSIDSLSHDYKTRALATTITNSYAIDGMNWFGASIPVDICDGGIVSFTSLYVRKGADGSRANNGGTIDWCSENYAGANGALRPTWAVNTLATNHITIDSMVDHNLGGSNQPVNGYRMFFYNIDPVRNIPITENLTNTAFYQTQQTVWAVGVGGGSPTPTSPNGSIANPPTLGTGNFASPTFGSGFSATPLTRLINPLTQGVPPVIPSAASMVLGSGSGPNIGSIPGVYDLTLTVPTGSGSGTNVVGGLLAAYPFGETEMSPVSWSVVEGGSNFSIATVGAAHVQLRTAAALADGIYWVGLQAVGTQTVRKSLAVIVGAGGAGGGTPPADSFTNGIYVPDSVVVSPDITTNTDLMTGFIRTTAGNATNYLFSVSNSIGGAPWLAVTVTTSTSFTREFKVRLTAAGAALSPSNLPAGGSPYVATITGTDGVNPFSKSISIIVISNSQTVAVSGANILPATQAPSGGAWAFNGSMDFVQYPDPTNTSLGDTPLPDSTFPTYVRFGAWPGYYTAGNQNDGDWANEAYVNGTLNSGPWFMCGFFRPEAFYTNGMMMAYGNHNGGNRDNGLIAFSLQGDQALSFEWTGGGFTILNIWADVWHGGTASQLVNQWQFTCQILNGAGPINTSTEGVAGIVQPGSVVWPTVAAGDALSVMLGSYYGPTVSADAHNFSGGLRNWLVASGTPTPTQLQNFRSNPTLANAQTLFGSGNIWGYWSFASTDPHTGAQEPDLSGNNRNLTYIDKGLQAGHALPYLVTAGVPYLIDGSGHFALVSIGGGAYQIQTTPSVTNLSSIYGAWPVTIVVNGYQFPTTLYVVSGS